MRAWQRVAQRAWRGWVCRLTSAGAAAQQAVALPQARHRPRASHRADDERKVGRDAEGQVKRYLRQVGSQLLEVDVFGAATLQRLRHKGRSCGAHVQAWLGVVWQREQARVQCAPSRASSLHRC
jgi:hypothetical protein